MKFCNSASAKLARKKRSVRLRLRNSAKGDQFRISVHKSNRHFYAQVIDDTKGVTIASACTLDGEIRDSYLGNANLEIVKKVAKLLAVKLRSISFASKLVFDRGSFKYVGRVAAFADALREDGFVF